MRLRAPRAYGKYGALYPFLPVYLKAYLGLPPLLVGTFAMIVPISVALAAPVVTGLADGEAGSIRTPASVAPLTFVRPAGSEPVVP